MKKNKNIFLKKYNTEEYNYSSVKRIIVKVVVGFGIIALLFVIAINVTNNKLTQLSGTFSDIMEPSIKLVYLREINSSLYSSELNIKAYTIKCDTVFLNNYEKNISTINKQMDTLLLLSTKDKIIFFDRQAAHHKFASQLDLLSKLISIRVDLFNEYIELKIGKNSQDVLVLLREKIKIRKPGIDENLNKQGNTPKKTFLSNLIQFKSTKNNSSSAISNETDKSSILRIINQTQKEEQIQVDKYLSKELSLTVRESEVMNKILKLLKQMEEKELAESIRRIYSATNDTSLQISFISTSLTALGLVFAFLFAFFIYLDILRVIRFRDELLEAKKNADIATLHAEESAKLMEEFLANMSHEIRTPMNAIVGFSDILSKRDLKEEEKEFITIIKEAGENLLTIINDILDISKLEAGMMIFEEKIFSVKETFRSLNILLMEKAKKNNLNLQFHFDDAVPETLIGDNIRLNQILIILIDNAIKFTQLGSVNVYVKSTQLKDGNSLLDFSVKDTGIGIPEEKLAIIFERFQQAEPHSTRKYGGTGLGLSIAKKMVELQGGTLSVKSTLTIGSEFSFSIPYKKSSVSVIIPEIIEMKCNMDELRKLNILIVEDNKLNIRLMKSLFAENQLRMQVAENGEVAISKIKEYNLKNSYFDIIMMDIEMPVMNGYEATTIIRTELNSAVPIIAMSAHAMAGEKEKCLSLGMNDFISKPIHAVQLFEKIYELTNKPFYNVEK